MANHYLTEPPTRGRVLLKTTVGDLEIELWSKEAPLACRNFVQLCMERYYDTCIFHRVVPKFMAQTGDPTGTGKGGESIYGKPFKDEFHSRIKFNHPGQVAMASEGNVPDSNGSQFFITLAPCEWLNKKHTIFGVVTGDSRYNALKMNEVETFDDKPLEPVRIVSAEILSNPFDDIVPRASRFEIAEKERKRNLDEAKKKAKRAAKKNFNLMSFGAEAEEDEQNAVADANVPAMSAQPSKVKKKKEKKEKRGKDVTADGDKVENLNVEIDIQETEPDSKSDKKKRKKEKSKSKKKKKKRDRERERTGSTSQSQEEKSDRPKKKKAKKQKTRNESDKDEDSRDKTSKALAEEYKAMRQKLMQEKEKSKAGSRGKTAKEMKVDDQADERLMSEYERRRYKYLRLSRANRQNQKNTLQSLEAFKQKLIQANKASGSRKPTQKHMEGNPKESKEFKGGIGENLTELDRDKKEKEEDSDWMTSRLSFRRHIDDDIQKGAMNWEMKTDDYAVSIRKKRR